MLVSGDDLYIGGTFTMVGGKVSPFIARAYLPDLPSLSVLSDNAGVNVSWPTAEGSGFVLEQGSTLAGQSNWITNTASVSDDGTNKSVIIAATNGPTFFRLRRP
jgi:hypothetical protein